MAIKIVPDVGAPVSVLGVELLAETYAPDYSEWATYLMAGGGYLGAAMGWGGPFLKNVGIAALPGAARKIYDRVRGGTSRRMSLRRVTRYPAPAEATPFQGVKLV